MKKGIKNIGGEFSINSIFSFLLEDSTYTFFPDKISDRKRLLLETGTDAICYAIIGHFYKVGKKKILIWFPEHYCNATIKRVTFVLAQLKVTFEICSYTQVSLDFLNLISEHDVVVYIHFNRYTPICHAILEYRNKLNFFLLEDFVLATFDIDKVKGDAGFNSLRKVSPLSISILYINKNVDIEIFESSYSRFRKGAALVKSIFELNNSSKLEEKYLELFKKAEVLLEEKLSISYSTPEDIALLDFVDWKSIYELRRINFETINKLLTSFSEYIIEGEYQFFMLKIPNRDKVRKSLFDLNIFPPIHWSDAKTKLSQEQISLPIDQRYDMKDMDKMSNALIKILQGV